MREPTTQVGGLCKGNHQKRRSKLEGKGPGRCGKGQQLGRVDEGGKRS